MNVIFSLVFWAKTQVFWDSSVSWVFYLRFSLLQNAIHEETRVDLSLFVSQIFFVRFFKTRVESGFLSGFFALFVLFLLYPRAAAYSKYFIFPYTVHTLPSFLPCPPCILLPLPHWAPHPSPTTRQLFIMYIYAQWPTYIELTFSIKYSTSLYTYRQIVSHFNWPALHHGWWEGMPPESTVVAASEGGGGGLRRAGGRGEVRYSTDTAADNIWSLSRIRVSSERRGGGGGGGYINIWEAWIRLILLSFIWIRTL